MKLNRLTIVKVLGVLSFSLAAWIVLKDTTILWAAFSLHHNYDSPPYFFILHFAGFSFEGWQIYTLATFLALTATALIGIGIFIFSSKK